MSHSKSALVLFTLSPKAEGKRKPLGLGTGRAAALYEAMLRHLEGICSDLPGVDLLISTPGQPSISSARHIQQKGAHFGESLRLALEEAFSMGYQKVVVIGNDAPEISRSYVLTAFARLESGGSQAAVMGPARDGGYTLLGLSQPCAEAFESMPWGSGRVARLTEERLLCSGFQVDRLETLEDIDNRAGLNRFLARARRGALAPLAKQVATLLTTGSSHYVPGLGSLQEVHFVGWRALRAPPCYCSN